MSDEKTPYEMLMQSAWQIPGWCWPRELEWLYRIAQESESKCHIEIGVFCGRSTFPTSMGMAEDGQIILVDPLEYDTYMKIVPMFGLPSSDWATKVLSATIDGILQRRPKLNIKHYKENSTNAAHLMQQDGIQPDTIYIDAGHHHEETLSDLEMYVPMLKPGGKIYGHDYCPREPGVIEAVNQFFGDNFYVIDNTRIWVHEKPLST
jgi:hypothetical protein